MKNSKELTDQEWKEKLSDEQYHILREKGTEAPFSGKLDTEERNGMYYCGACGNILFSSHKKYDAGCGWPSFYDVEHSRAVELIEDKSFKMNRTEVVCKICGSHLGHVFPDGPQDKTGQRYCINSAALNFKLKK